MCLKGEAAPSEIDDYVDLWHEGGTSVSLQEFLGFTSDEYHRWALDADALDAIVTERRKSAGAPLRRAG